MQKEIYRKSACVRVLLCAAVSFTTCRSWHRSARRCCAKARCDAQPDHRSRVDLWGRALVALPLRNCALRPCPTQPVETQSSSTQTGRNGLAAEASAHPQAPAFGPIFCWRSSILTPHTSWARGPCAHSVPSRRSQDMSGLSHQRPVFVSLDRLGDDLGPRARRLTFGVFVKLERSACR